MSLEPGADRTPSGIRSLLYVASDRAFSKRSLVAVRSNAARAEMTGRRGLVSAASSQSIYVWPFASAFDFDLKYNAFVPLALVYAIPCQQVRFQLGEEVYVSTDDGVPGTNRVRRRRAKAYSYDVTFPIIITASADGSRARGVDAVYADVLGPFLRGTTAAYPTSAAIDMPCMKIATSQQLNPNWDQRLYPSVLERFSAEVSGVGGAQPITCSLRSRGILRWSIAGVMHELWQYWPKSHGMSTPAAGSTTLANGTFLRDARYIDTSVHGVDAEVFGGRMATIKDCSISLGNVAYEDVVQIRISIDQKLDFVSNGDRDLPQATYLRYADWVHLDSRVVKGSFSYLSASVVAGTPSSIWPGGSSPVPHSIPISAAAATFSNLDNMQFASPLWMDLGGLIFSMPAVYWQPSVQELSTGASLVTINFVARGDVIGRGDVG